MAQKVVKKILNLESVKMAEVAPNDTTHPPTLGRPTPARPPINDASQWVERFSLMAGILCTRFPEKAGELLAYQAVIWRAERNYEKGQWVTYDRQYRREALARKDLNWFVTDPALSNEVFTGRARQIQRCSMCWRDAGVFLES